MADLRSFRMQLASSTLQLLACPHCHGSLILDQWTLRCAVQSCGRMLALSDDVVMVEERRTSASFFDDTLELMLQTHRDPGTRCMFYSKQAKWLDLRLAEDSGKKSVLVDVGCGPKLPYHRPRKCFLVGVDLSFESIRRNNEVDLRVFGPADCLPLRDASADVIVCFYSLHHMVGRCLRDNRLHLERTFSEFGRVLKPGGCVFVFEISPVRLADLLQDALWNIAKRVYSRFDMYFWSERALQKVSSKSLPSGTEFQRREFKTPPWVMFQFVFAWPRFRLPRLLYPFRAYVYEWRLPFTELGTKPALDSRQDSPVWTTRSPQS